MSAKYFDLIKHLTLREIKARYKQSFLGFFWVVLNPFFQMLILSFVFSQVLRFSDLGVPYPIFLYAGLLPWTFFNTALGAAMGSLVENAALLKKIYFPREILVLSVLLAKTIDFFLASLVFLVLMLWFQIPLKPYMLIFSRKNIAIYLNLIRYRYSSMHTARYYLPEDSPTGGVCQLEYSYLWFCLFLATKCSKNLRVCLRILYNFLNLILSGAFF